MQLYDIIPVFREIAKEKMIQRWVRNWADSQQKQKNIMVITMENNEFYYRNTSLNSRIEAEMFCQIAKQTLKVHHLSSSPAKCSKSHTCAEFKHYFVRTF